MPHLSPLYRFSDGFVCGFQFWPNFFAVLDDFFFGFAVSNTPQCPPPERFIEQFHTITKCSGKFDCLVKEMLYIRMRKPTLNVQTDSIRAKVFV